MPCTLGLCDRMARGAGQRNLCQVFPAPPAQILAGGLPIRRTPTPRRQCPGDLSAIGSQAVRPAFDRHQGRGSAVTPFCPVPYRFPEVLTLSRHELFFFPPGDGCPIMGPYIKLSARRYAPVRLDPEIHLPPDPLGALMPTVINASRHPQHQGPPQGAPHCLPTLRRDRPRLPFQLVRPWLHPLRPNGR
jgi:hypothetical protein